MNISYNWLKTCLDFDLTPTEVADALTSIGLETGSVQEFQTIRGGLQGLVVGHVLTCIDHPDSDHLHVTTVDAGLAEPLQIVCGAPNVAAGQKVIVALPGTTLYKGDESFVIRKSKIRGLASNGMICAEDETGIGTAHDGIIVLPPDVAPGTPASEYYDVKSDYVLEVDITPNRVDATSHFGVARDLAAYLRQNNLPATLRRPSVDAFSIDDPTPAIAVTVENAEACPRYSALTIRGVTVGQSPAWLKNALTTIGLRPINNVVDITNYVLHELGQPLHAFDADRIKGNRVVVRTLPAGTQFVTLDEVERTLTDRDLMICNAEEGMCIGGVFGGLDSGVTERTTNVFLESANFNPTWIRQTARRFGLHTDASFRFERGLDPNQTLYVLQRAALLIREIAGGRITGPVQDIYPAPVDPCTVELAYRKINSLTGQIIPPATIKHILAGLEIDILAETTEGLTLRVPVYRIDVRRDVDVIEDILRIYGYNNICVSDSVKSNLNYQTPTDRSHKLQRLISEQLCGAGFNEILNNSQTRSCYYDALTTWPSAQSVMLANAISTELNCMRQTLLFGGLESIEHNIKRQNSNLRFFEFGNCYHYDDAQRADNDPIAGFTEDYRLGLWLCGNRVENNWAHPNEPSSVYELKAVVEQVLVRLGVDMRTLSADPLDNDIFSAGQLLSGKSFRRPLGVYGILNRSLLKAMDIAPDVYYAELSWTALMKEILKSKPAFSPISRFQTVKRDLALLIDKQTTFAEIERIAAESERKLLRHVTLFDVYEGKNLPAGKKSYAVSFYLQNPEGTLNDKQIESIMQKIQTNLERRLNAQLR
ncbi:MAG: phenylalanine--tRNA ligase subunit beta [Tannerellaceae bacterium]|jgi:phenylalanyl-tRNA synthetase beta chain|nr:phenylalanine--tRNA ligase subunit beta [Tannerellaceae bacterium]